MENQLRKFRRYQRMSLVDLAEKSGVAASTIGDIERGATPGLDTAYKLASALEKSVYSIWPHKSSKFM